MRWTYLVWLATYRRPTARLAVTGRRILFVALLIGGLVSVPPALLFASDAHWDASPYHVHVWLAWEDVPEIRDAWRSSVVQEIRTNAQVNVGVACQFHVTDAPVAIRNHFNLTDSPPSPDQIAAATTSTTTTTTTTTNNNSSSTDARQDPGPRDPLDGDKLFVVVCRNADDAIGLRVMELDCRTQNWGPSVKRRIRQPQQLGGQISEAIFSAFRPVGLIDQATNDSVRVRMRSGLLIVDSNSPLLLRKGELAIPITRKTDRLGKLAKGGIQEIPWTILQVADDELGSIIHCDIVSGLRSPIRTRSSRAIQRLVLAVEPLHDETVIQVHAREDESRNLAGMDIYMRVPGGKKSTPVGRTSALGEVTVVRDKNPIHMIYVQSGDRLLARLPVVPGWIPHQRAAVSDDTQRLIAEGFVKGLREEMIDQVALRKLLAARCEKQIEAKELREAERILDQIRSLPSQGDFARALQSRRQQLSGNNRAVQGRIDKLFGDTDVMLQKYLTTADVEELQRKLLAAKQAK